MADLSNMGGPAQKKDGFDLLEYPCDYLFKAMGHASDSNDLCQEMSKLALQVVAPNCLLLAKTAVSRTGKFESVTLKIRLQNRAQLEDIYQRLSSSPLVLMTL